MDARWERAYSIAVSVALILLIGFLWWNAEPIENAILTFNVPVETNTTSMIKVMEVIGEKPATFFLTANWAQNNSALARNLSQKYEIACFTSSGTRLMQLTNTELETEITDCKSVLENITGKEVVGFRAPDNDVGGYAKTLVEQHFMYDSSQYRRLEWFYEPVIVTQIPVTTFLFIPLDDEFGISIFRLGDLFYTMIRHTKQSDVVVALDINRAAEHDLDLEYTIASLERKNVTFMTVQEFISTGREK